MNLYEEGNNIDENSSVNSEDNIELDDELYETEDKLNDGKLNMNESNFLNQNGDDTIELNNQNDKE
jgi:hypothetical protein